MGLTLNRYRQLAVYAIQSVGLDVAAVWLVDVGIHPVRLFPSANLVPFGRRGHARGRWHCRGKPGRAPQHGQA